MSDILTKARIAYGNHPEEILISLQVANGKSRILEIEEA